MLCMCISAGQTHQWGTYLISRPEHVASLTAGAAPEAHMCFSWVETKLPGHCCFLYFCKTLQTPQEVRDSAATTLKSLLNDMYPLVKSQAMNFLFCYLFLPFVQLCSEARTGCELDYKSTRETTETGIWERKQAANQGVPQLPIEISACKQENPSDILPQVPQCHTLQKNKSLTFI